jgi:hypothetical protein
MASRYPPLRKEHIVWELVDDAIQTSRTLAMDGLRSRHPDATPGELQRRFFGLWLGEELATLVYATECDVALDRGSPPCP